jgi:hypothetical protein
MRLVERDDDLAGAGVDLDWDETAVGRRDRLRE